MPGDLAWVRIFEPSCCWPGADVEEEMHLKLLIALCCGDFARLIICVINFPGNNFDLDLRFRRLDYEEQLAVLESHCRHRHGLLLMYVVCQIFLDVREKDTVYA
jgi:hypothetical protein